MLDSGRHRRLSPLVGVVCLEFNRRHTPEGFEPVPVAVPVHPSEGGELHRLAVTPRPAPGGIRRTVAQTTLGRTVVVPFDDAEHRNYLMQRDIV